MLSDKASGDAVSLSRAAREASKDGQMREVGAKKNSPKCGKGEGEKEDRFCLLHDRRATKKSSSPSNLFKKLIFGGANLNCGKLWRLDWRGYLNSQAQRQMGNLVAIKASFRLAGSTIYVVNDPCRLQGFANKVCVQFGYACA